jgi:hypothetical protein
MRCSWLLEGLPSLPIHTKMSTEVDAFSASSYDKWYIFKRIFQVGTIRHCYDTSGRPPYPIIIESPQFKDVIANMGVPEMWPAMVMLPVGAMTSYRLTAGFQHIPIIRRRAFGLFWGIQVFGAFYLGVKHSFYKLIGFEDNGLRWRTTDGYKKRYSFSDKLRANSFMNMFVRKDFDNSRHKI